MLHNYFIRANDSKEYDDKKKLNTFLNIIALKLREIDGKEKGVRRKIRTYKSTKMLGLPELFQNTLKGYRYSKEEKPLSNKSLLQFRKSLLQDEKNFLNNPLVHNFLNNRKNSDKERSSQLKINVLNLYKKYKKTTKDPLQIIEEIAVHIYLFILKKSLHKI